MTEDVICRLETMTFSGRAGGGSHLGPRDARGRSIETPWGNSARLRERRLRPGPGASSGDVARNQRARLLAAMVASVAERGYAGTRLTDLVELSGVARKSFYALFADKERCFVEAVETMVAAVIETTTRPSGSWEEQVRVAAASFAELVVAQPAAARMCLTETYVVGPAALAPVEAAIDRFEAHALAVAREAGMEGEDLREMIRANVGAMMEIARERLREGREAELPKLIDDFLDLALSYRPPPRALRAVRRAPAAAPEAPEAHGHVERVLGAFASVVAERGYRATTIELVLRRAAMSPTTFYANFAGKEEVLFAAIESAGLQLLAAVLPTFHRNPQWTHGVRAAYGHFFDFLASRPALARVLLVEVYGAGPCALARREESLRPLGVMLAEGRGGGGNLPPVAMKAIAGGVLRLAYRQILDHGTASLPSLTPLCTYLALSPFIGAEAACEVANGEGRGRGALPEGRDRVSLSRVALLLGDNKATPEMIARELGAPVETVGRLVDDLVRAGLVVGIEEDVDDGQTELFYHSDSDFLDDEVWGKMSVPRREAISRHIAASIRAEIDQAIELGSFDARPDRHLSRMRLLLDEPGWDELMAIHHQAFEATIRVQAQSADRLQRSRGVAIAGSSVQILFEVPKPPY
jgi:AcrR family transcriptional regulator